MKELETKSNKRDFSAKRAAMAVAAAALALLVILCAVLGSTRGRERSVKVTYDGASYTGMTSQGGHGYNYNGNKAAGTGGISFDGYAASESFASPDMDMSVSMAAPADAPAGPDIRGDAPEPDNGSRKIVYTYDYDAETTDFDGFLSMINDFLSDCGGYAEGSSVASRDFDRFDKSSTDTVRRGTYYFKIPAEKCGEFRELLAAGESKITYENKRMSDKTKAYSDLGLQKQSYLAEYAALERLLDQADQVSDLIDIQDRLSYLNYQIQYFDKQMSLIDEDVAYSDVTVDLYEVVYYTATIQEYKYRFGERMADAFEDFVYAIPQFLFAMAFLAAGGFVVIGLSAVMFRVLFNIRNKKSRDQVIRLVRDDPKESSQE